MLSLEECVLRLCPLEKDILSVFKAHFKKVEYPAKHCLIEQNTISDKLYFLAKGSIHSFYKKGNQEITLWFGTEGDFFSCFRSVIKNVKGLETIGCYEASTFYEINYKTFNKLTQTHPELNQLYRKVLEEAYLYWEDRVMLLQFYTAKERYELMLKKSPHIFERFLLSQIASYLGMTQETLSRMRKK